MVFITSRRKNMEIFLALLLVFSALIFLELQYRQSKTAIKKMQTEFKDYMRQLEVQSHSGPSKLMVEKIRIDVGRESPPKEIMDSNLISTGRDLLKASTDASTNASEESVPTCPLAPKTLLGPIVVNLTDENPLRLVPDASNIEFVGHWRPKNCKPRAKVAFLVPLRNRPLQLQRFLQHIIPILQRQLLQYGIFVIEQIGTTAFNKGAIYNLGFNTTFRYDDYDCYIFHDVDLLAEDDRNYYGCPSSPLHMSVAIDKFKYKLPYSNIFGGIQAFKKQHYITVNGFSNQYWGWGAEDDDMFRRVKKAGLKLTRAPADKGRYKMNQGQHYRSPGRKIWEARNKGLLFYHPLNLKQDGLSTISSLSYQMNIREMKLCTHISIDLSFTGGGE